MNEAEIFEIENRVKTYLQNARYHFDNGDYVRALSFLDLAQSEIERLAGSPNGG